MHLARLGFTLIAAGWAAAAAAQPAAAPLTYRSALKDYRPFTDAAVGSWKQANETVREVGGWRAYAKEAQAPAKDGGKTEGAGGHKH